MKEALRVFSDRTRRLQRGSRRLRSTETTCPEKTPTPQRRWSRGILSALFPWLFGLEKRLIGTAMSFRGSSVANRACPSEYALAAIPGASMHRGILAVVDEDDTAIREQRRRPYFGECAVEVSRPIAEQHDRLAG